MKAELKPVGGIDHGTPPPAVLQQQERVKSLLKADENASASETPVPVNGSAISGMEQAAAALIRPRMSIPPDRVSLQFIPADSSMPGFKLEFDVAEVCIKEHYISLLVASDLGFEPTRTMKFKLVHRGKTYPVIFAGAEFEFKTINARGISFLRDEMVAKSENQV